MQNKKEIQALNRLVHYCANARFNLMENEFPLDEIGNHALLINEKIKLNSGLNLFEIKSPEDYWEYEKYLNALISSEIKLRFASADVAEESELIINSEIVSPEWIRNFPFHLNKKVRMPLKFLHISDDELKDCFASATNVSSVKMLGSIWLAKSTIHRNTNRILLLHCVNTKDGDPWSSALDVLGSIQSIDQFESFVLTSIMLFDENEFFYLIQNPLNLFLKGLELFGMKTRVFGGPKKILHLDVPIPSNVNILKEHNWMQPNNFTPNDQPCYLYRTSQIQENLSYFYCISAEKMISKLN